MAKKKTLMDGYLTWINKGELQARLNDVQILVKTGSDDKTCLKRSARRQFSIAKAMWKEMKEHPFSFLEHKYFNVVTPVKICLTGIKAKIGVFYAILVCYY